MKNTLSRRHFVQSSALAAAAGVTSLPLAAHALPAAAGPGAIRLGIASYTFRSFPRAKMIEYLKQLRVTDLNTKDTKDHLPMDPAAEDQAIADYKAAGIALHAAGTIYFPKDEDAGIPVIVAGAPAPEVLPRIEKFVKEYDIRFAIHNHGPEDKIWHSPLDVLKAVKGMDARMGCCVDVGHTMRAGDDPVK